MLLGPFCFTLHLGHSLCRISPGSPLNTQWKAWSHTTAHCCLAVILTRSSECLSSRMLNLYWPSRRDYHFIGTVMVSLAIRYRTHPK